MTNDLPRRSTSGDFTSNTPVARQGFVGALESFSRRRAADRFRKELDAIASALAAASQVHEAKEQYQRSMARISPTSLDDIEKEERDRVAADRAVQEMRLAKLNLEKANFEMKAEIETLNLQADLEAARQRLQAVKAKGLAEAGATPTKEEKRTELNKEIETLVRKLQKLDQEYLARVEADDVNDAYEQSYNFERNRIVDRLDKLAAEEEAL